MVSDLSVRLPSGRLDAVQVSVLCRVAADHADGRVGLLPGPGLVLRPSSPADLVAGRDLLDAAGLREPGPQLVSPCPEASTAQDEPFDVTGDGLVVAGLLGDELPGTALEVVLGGCGPCAAAALRADLGLVAVCGRRGPGYQVWVAGGPRRLGQLLHPFVGREQLWPAVRAVAGWQQEVGGRRGSLWEAATGHGRAGVRAGIAGNHHGPSFSWAPELPGLAAHRSVPGRPGLRGERRPGLVTIEVGSPGGWIDADDLRAVAAVSIGPLALSRSGTVLVRSVPLSIAGRALQAVSQLGLALPRAG